MPRAPKFAPVAATELARSPQNLYVGTSGWAYPTWKPGFYPADVPTRAFLYNYGSRLTSVEVNYTFRTLPTGPQLQAWLAATPPGFRFSFKAPQRITHFQRLVECEEETAEFLAAIEPVRRAKRLGPLLFQLPPNFVANAERLAKFLSMPAFKRLRFQIAFEFRHASWFAEPIYQILRRHKAALCVAESDDLVTPDIATTNFRCYRLRRNGGYSRAETRALATRFGALAAEQEVFVYFKHEDKPTGPLSAEALLHAANRTPPRAAP